MIYFTGDTHGMKRFGPHSVDGYTHRFNTEVFPEQEQMSKEDYVVVCVDFSGVWNLAEEDVIGYTTGKEDDLL